MLKRLGKMATDKQIEKQRTQDVLAMMTALEIGENRERVGRRGIEIGIEI